MRHAVYNSEYQWGFLQPSMNLSLFDSIGVKAADELALQMSSLIKQKCFRKELLKLTPFDFNSIPEDQLPRVKMMLGMLAQAFVWCNGEDEKTHYVPESIAIPLVGVSARLKEPPILNYADYILRNTQLKIPEMVHPALFKSVYTFTGMKSEFGFILSHILYELKGREAIQVGLKALSAAVNHEEETTGIALTELYVIILDLIEQFNTVHKTTKEEDFREHFRVFLKGWKSIIPDMTYRGVSINAGELRGETGAQSSLLPFLDGVIGVSNTLMQHSSLYHAWRPYMPEADRLFLSDIGFLGEKLREFVRMNTMLIDAYNKVLISLMDFRKNHLMTITQYIEGKNSKVFDGIGTGGTFYSTYLNGLIAHLQTLLL